MCEKFATWHETKGSDARKKAVKQEKHDKLVFHTKRSNIIGFIKEKGFNLITFLPWPNNNSVNDYDPPFH